jgi:hypothetical protein
MKKLILSKSTIRFFTPLFFFIVFMSCAGANYGGLRFSRDVSNLFESYQVLDSHSYYYSGSDARPNGILGLQKNYTLRSKLWKPVELTPDQLRLWVNMMTDHRGTSIRIYGSHVIAPDGTEIGIWYSPWDWTTVKMEDDRHVLIGTPSPSPINKKRVLLFGMDED